VRLGIYGSTRHYQAAGRPFELLVGTICALCGGGLAALGGFALFVVFARRGSPLGHSGLLFISILYVLATLFLVLAWRLIWNRARASDGGLFSPLGLRVGGLIFLAGPVAAFFTHPIGVVHTAAALAASGACFKLARHREQYLSQGAPPAA